MESLERLKNSLKKTYQGKKVLITGNTGFKGAWLSLWLHHLGAKVIGYSLKPPTRPNLFDICNLSKKIKQVDGDVRDFKHLNQVIQKNKPDYIFHLAAQALVIKSYEDPVETFSTNVEGTTNLLESLKRNPFSTSVIIVTSDKCYFNDGRKKAFVESDALGGHDPYSASKACAEIVTDSYRQSFFSKKESRVKIASVRAGNVIGGGDWATDRLIPDAMRALSKKKPIPIRNPSYIRPWQYVLEPLYGYLLLGGKLSSGKKTFQTSFNFGPDKKDIRKVSEVIDSILREWGSGTFKLMKKKNSQKEAHALLLNCTKAKKVLNWKPRWGLQRGVHETVWWYQSFFNNRKETEKYCLEQINQFLIS